MLERKRVSKSLPNEKRLSHTAATIHRLIVKIGRERGITSIVVTHDLAGALDFADRIMLLKDGKCVECLPPAEFASSTNPVVREFVSAAISPSACRYGREA